MASPVDFAPIQLTRQDETVARRRMRQAWGPQWWRTNPAGWVGFAAELALIRAWNARQRLKATESPVLSRDLDIQSPGAVTTVEVKTRTALKGWTDPRRFEWIQVPTHQGREPIKEVDLVWFAWWSRDQPRRLWVLGYLRGPDEFKRRATFYREGEAMPRGWAREGGEWALELKQLRPFPRRTFKEAA